MLEVNIDQILGWEGFDDGFLQKAPWRGYRMGVSPLPTIFLNNS